MPMNREQELPGGIPPMSPEQLREPQMVQFNELIFRDELSIHEQAADALTQAGLGIYHFTIADEQVVPLTGRPVNENSLFIVVNYTGLENRDKLSRLIGRAKFARRKMDLQPRATREEIERAIRYEIGEGVSSELQREASANAMMDNIFRNR